MNLQEIDAYFTGLFDFEAAAKADNAINGLQVERKNRTIERIGFAVDASCETFLRAVEKKVDLLFVHHGLFWGREKAVRGTFYKRLKILIENDMALYAVHLPLDMHPETGNNYGLAAKIGLKQVEPFGLYKGIKIGCKGFLAEAVPLPEIFSLLPWQRDECLGFLPFGKKDVRSIGLVSGGGTDELVQAIDEDLDLFITGDVSHTVYHECLEGKINMLSMGHYWTETIGVSLLEARVQRELGCETVFVDLPTGL